MKSAINDNNKLKATIVRVTKQNILYMLGSKHRNHSMAEKTTRKRCERTEMIAH